MAGRTPRSWMLVLCGFLLGLVVSWGINNGTVLGGSSSLRSRNRFLRAAPMTTPAAAADVTLSCPVCPRCRPCARCTVEIEEQVREEEEQQEQEEEEQQQQQEPQQQPKVEEPPSTPTPEVETAAAVETVEEPVALVESQNLYNNWIECIEAEAADSVQPDLEKVLPGPPCVWRQVPTSCNQMAWLCIPQEWLGEEEEGEGEAESGASTARIEWGMEYQLHALPFVCPGMKKPASKIGVNEFDIVMVGWTTDRDRPSVIVPFETIEAPLPRPVNAGAEEPLVFSTRLVSAAPKEMGEGGDMHWMLRIRGRACGWPAVIQNALPVQSQVGLELEHRKQWAPLAVVANSIDIDPISVVFPKKEEGEEKEEKPWLHTTFTGYWTTGHPNLDDFFYPTKRYENKSWTLPLLAPEQGTPIPTHPLWGKRILFLGDSQARTVFYLAVSHLSGNTTSMFMDQDPCGEGGKLKQKFQGYAGRTGAQFGTANWGVFEGDGCWSGGQEITLSQGADADKFVLTFHTVMVAEDHAFEKVIFEGGGGGGDDDDEYSIVITTAGVMHDLYNTSKTFDGYATRFEEHLTGIRKHHAGPIIVLGLWYSTIQAQDPMHAWSSTPSRAQFIVEQQLEVVKRKVEEEGDSLLAYYDTRGISLAGEHWAHDAVHFKQPFCHAVILDLLGIGQDMGEEREGDKEVEEDELEDEEEQEEEEDYEEEEDDAEEEMQQL